jgi:hypothetical protein
MKTKYLLTGCLFAMALPAWSATAVMSSLNTFGGGDGWLAPGEGGYTFLGTGSTERGLDYSPVTGHLYLPSRVGSLNVRILNSATGVDLGGLDMTGVSGGTFGINQVGVADDGTIYVSNLQSGTSAANPFKIYRWANELSLPTVFTTVSLTGVRLGDTMDVTGSGANTVIAAGYSNAPAITGNNGYVLVNPSANVFSDVAVAGALAGEMRSGITFVNDANTIWGDARSGGVRRTTWSGTIGTSVTGTAEPGTNMLLTSSNEGPIDIALINGVWVMATVEVANSTTDNNDVRLYDVTDAVLNHNNNKTLLATANLTGSTFVANLGLGGITWGAISGDTATLYAMSTNNGIQAFTVQVVPEPSAAAALLGGIATLLSLRRRRC